MGLHSGEASERDGDYFGPAVIRAARLMSIGHGGQVLVSNASAGLLGGRSHHAEMLRAAGKVALRGLDGLERVSELRYPGLEVEFPPLASRRPRAGNLPVVPDELIGRRDVLDHAVGALGDVSLLTLVGPGGVGKTRLSIEVGAAVADRFGDGVWFVPLASVTDETDVPNAVAEVLGVQETAGRSLTESIVGAIVGRDLPLILDNCEHVIDGARRFAGAIARDAEPVTVLATSREPLLSHEATAMSVKAHAQSRAGHVIEARRTFTEALDLNGVGDFGELLWYTVLNIVEHLTRIDRASGAVIAFGALRAAPAAPSDDLVSRALVRMRHRIEAHLDDDIAELEAAGAAMRLAELIRFLQQELDEHSSAASAA